MVLDIEGIKYVHSKCLQSFQTSGHGVTRHQSTLGLRIQESRGREKQSEEIWKWTASLHLPFQSIRRKLLHDLYLIRIVKNTIL